MSKYALVIALPKEFVEQVNKYVDRGYCPVGGVCVVHCKVENDLSEERVSKYVDCLCQAMFGEGDVE